MIFHYGFPKFCWFTLSFFFFYVWKIIISQLICWHSNTDSIVRTAINHNTRLNMSQLCASIKHCQTHSLQLFIVRLQDVSSFLSTSFSLALPCSTSYIARSFLSISPVCSSFWNQWFQNFISSHFLTPEGPFSFWARFLSRSLSLSCRESAGLWVMVRLVASTLLALIAAGTIFNCSVKKAARKHLERCRFVANQLNSTALKHRLRSKP